MKIIQIEELAQGYREGEQYKDYVSASITKQGRTLYIKNPNGISISVMISSDKVNWVLATMNGADLIVTETTQIPVNNYGQWVQLQVADEANVTGIIANII